MGHSRPIPAHVATLCVAALVLAFLAGVLPARGELGLLAALVGCVVGLDLADSDLFGRGKFSPGTVPTIALAAARAVGPVVAEGFAAFGRLVRGVPVVRVAFEFWALSVCATVAA